MNGGQSPADAKEKNNGKRKWLLVRLVVIFTIAGSAWAAWWHYRGQFREVTDNAYVSGNIVAVNAQVSGTVISIMADNTDFVHKGDPLAQLDEADAKLELDKAAQELAGMVRLAGNMIENVNAQKARVALKQTELEKAKADYARREKLFAERSITEETFQNYRFAVESARSALDQAEHELAEAKIAAAGRSVNGNPRVKAAKTRVRELYLALQRTRVFAPVDGYVAKRGVQVGDRATPGKALMALVPLDALSVEANFKEDQLAAMRTGQPVTLISDLYGRDIPFHGRVIGVNPGTGAVFSLLPAQNATGNWIKVVQRVPVKISLDPGELKAHPLVIGLSLKAIVDTHNRALPPLSAGVSGRPLTTDVYAADEKGADGLINRVVMENLAAGKE